MLRRTARVLLQHRAVLQEVAPAGAFAAWTTVLPAAAAAQAAPRALAAVRERATFGVRSFAAGSSDDDELYEREGYYIQYPPSEVSVGAPAPLWRAPGARFNLRVCASLSTASRAPARATGCIGARE